MKNIENIPYIYNFIIYLFQKVTHDDLNTMKESYEKMPIYTSIMASLGFYFLIFIGLINHIIFTPKVATEKNRKVKMN